MLEIEVKLHVPASARHAVDAEVAAGVSRRTRLQAIYFDTPDRRLAAAGLALRLRRSGRRWLQTLKAGGPDALQRLEHEVELTGALAVPAGSLPGIDPRRHGGTTAGDRLVAALAAREGDNGPARLVEQYRTDIWRRHRELRTVGAGVELAFDDGRIIAGAMQLPVCELEIELLRGRARAVVEVARRWVRRHGLWLDVRSKSQRGDRLARDAQPGPVVKASAVQLEPALTPDAALHAVIANCLQHALPNASEVADGQCSDEHVHQLRVGLRRLRSAMRFFAGWTTPVAAPWLEPLTALFRQLSVARDRDALAASLLPALRAAGAPLFELPPAPPGPTPTELLRSPASTLAMLDVLAFQLGGTPAVRITGEAPSPGAEEAGGASTVALPLAAAAALRLQRWHRRITRAAKRYAELDDVARHRLRRRVKRLRYAAEFVGSLYATKPVARYLARLAPVQDSLGRYNDLCVGLETYRSAVGDDPRAWFAIGWLTARRDVLLAESAAALKDFARSKPFWDAP